MKEAFVGRKREIGQFFEFLKKDIPAFIVIGEPGIGKSSFMREVAKRLRSDKKFVVGFHEVPFSAGATDPFVGVLEDSVNDLAVRGEEQIRNVLKRVAETGRKIAIEKGDRVARALAKDLVAKLVGQHVVEELVELKKELDDTPTIYSLADEFIREHRSEFIYDLREFFSKLVKEFSDREFVLLIDQFERAPMPSSDVFLDFVKEWHENVHVVVALRVEEIGSERFNYVKPHLNQMGAKIVELPSLSIEEIEEWMRSLGKIFSDPELEKIRKLSAGFPFAISEWLRTSKEWDLRDFKAVRGRYSALKNVSDKWTNLTIDSLKLKYDPRLYVGRRKIEEEFEEFLDSDKIGFIIVGDAGYGKTSLACHLAQKYQKNELVLFYNSSSLPTVDIKKQIMNDICPTPELRIATFFEEFMDEIGQVLEENNKRLIILIDAINESKSSRTLLKNINDAVARVNSSRIKIVLTCRTIIWNLLLDISDFLYRPKYFLTHGNREIRLDEFTEQELKGVYELYKQRFELKTDFSSLSSKTRDSCKVPLLLRMISEVYHGKVIPPYVPIGSVFDEWYNKMVERDMKILLERIVETMMKEKTNSLTIWQLRQDPYIEKCFSDSSPDSPYLKLLDRGILNEKGEHSEMVGFTFDKFFEYLLAKRIFPPMKRWSKDNVVKVISQAEDFNSVIGAVKIALIIKRDPILLSELAGEEKYEIRKILVDTLATMGEDDFDVSARAMERPLSLQHPQRRMERTKNTNKDIFIIA
jgi:Cdc6-like AAA superfamily ATPase